METTPEAPAPPAAPAAPKVGAMSFVRRRLMGLIEEYGKLALIVYFSIFFLVWVGMALAIRLGWSSDTVVATAGTWTAAYLLTKVTQPLRIGATVVITPALAAVWRRVRRPVPAAVPSDGAEPPSAAGGQGEQ